MATEKACSRCGEVKPLDEFALNRHRVDGHQSLLQTVRAGYATRFLRQEPHPDTPVEPGEIPRVRPSPPKRMPTSTPPSTPRNEPKATWPNRYRHGIAAVSSGMAEQWKTFLVRVTPEQHAKLKRLSDENDRSLAATVRKLIDRAQEPKP